MPRYMNVHCPVQMLVYRTGCSLNILRFNSGSFPIWVEQHLAGFGALTFLLEPKGRVAAWASFTIWILLSFKLNNEHCLRRLIWNFNNKKPWLKRIWSATQAGTYVLYMKLIPSVQDPNPVGPGTSWTGRTPELSSRVRIRSFGQCCGPLTFWYGSQIRVFVLLTNGSWIRILTIFS
jgi:hypothetical protein